MVKLPLGSPFAFSTPSRPEVRVKDSAQLHMQPEGEHPPAVRMLSGCQEAVNKLSREKIFFAQTHFLESTNQNTNVNTKIPKNKNRRNFSSGCQEAVKKLSTRCRRAVGPALRENPSSTEVKSCQSAPQGVSIDPCQADTKKFRPALLAVQGVFTLCHYLSGCPRVIDFASRTGS